MSTPTSTVAAPAAPKASKPSVPATKPATPTGLATSQPQRKTGDYNGTVQNTRVILTGDKPVIFTTVKLSEEFHVTHVVRLKTSDPAKTAQAIRIGFEELRRAFPNELALLTDEQLVDALDEKKLNGLPVNVSIVPQMKNNLPVRLKNADGSPGEIAFNVRLNPAEKMNATVRGSLLKGILAPTLAKPKAQSAFDTTSPANREAAPATTA